MKKMVFLICFVATTLFAMAYKSDSGNQKIDDWDYNSSIVQTKYKRGNILLQSKAMVSMESIGFVVGGAKDANNFYENIHNAYLPKISSLTYEGVFYDHYFKSSQKEECKELFCPSYITSIEKNIYTKEPEYYLSVGLNSGIKESDFKRKKLNLVVVLDISGSMGVSFDEYYYDKGQKVKLSNEELKKTKMQIANETIVSMMDHLKDEDNFGVVLFDNRAYRAKPLRLVESTDMSAIKKHILNLRQKGGTNWSGGFKEGLKLFAGAKKDPNVYENRIIFLTDAMPNRGELSKEGLFGLVDGASKEGVYTSFVGVGVDFNNDLVERVSKTKGANYYSVHSASEFKKRLDDEFDFMVTPLVFDLKLKVDSANFEIEAVYGSPEANMSTGEVMRVNTLFPSKKEDDAIKGGIILLNLKKIGDGDSLRLSVSYKDRGLNPFSNKKTFSFKNQNDSSIKKAILLSNYVTLMKNWMIDMRRGCNDKVFNPPFEILKRSCMIYPPYHPDFYRVVTWERKSCALSVSDGYKKIFSIFKNHFGDQMKVLHDKSLEKEYNLIKKLIEIDVKDGTKVDDWQIKGNKM